MSTKIDCIIYLKSKLEKEFAKLHFAKIEPFFEPLSPKFFLMVKVQNESIISGNSSATNFDEYVALLVTALQT
jgi:hypothetical protein